ncbi:MAG: 6-phosphogluconolactonase [Pseudomonadota bacterium]
MNTDVQVAAWELSPQAWDEVSCASGRAAARALAQAVARRLRAAIDARGSAVLAVSGGRSPMAWFHEISQIELPWDCVSVTLVDERCVPHDHADSNWAMVKKHLLQQRAASAVAVPLVNVATSSDSNPQTPDQWLQHALQQWQHLPHADVVVLGMGTDGHTASLFPGCAELPHALSWSCEERLVSMHPLTAAHQRVSMTLREMASSGHVMLDLGGQAKHDVYVQAKQAADLRWPISFVLNAAREGRLGLTVWLHDGVME